MPSPVKKYSGVKFYRRSDGAWVRKKGEFVKVGKNNYTHLPHYSMRDTKRDRKRRAKKSYKLRRRYPQEYD